MALNQSSNPVFARSAPLLESLRGAPTAAGGAPPSTARRSG